MRENTHMRLRIMLGEAKVAQMQRRNSGEDEDISYEATTSLIAFAAGVGTILAFPVLNPFLAGLMAAHTGVTATVLISVGKGILNGKTPVEVAKEVGVGLAVAQSVEKGIKKALENG